jgi:hypothetical protein
MLGQMVDDHVHELDLRGRQVLAGQEPGKGILGRLAVKADERPHEQAPPRVPPSSSILECVESGQTAWAGASKLPHDARRSIRELRERRCIASDTDAHIRSVTSRGAIPRSERDCRRDRAFEIRARFKIEASQAIGGQELGGSGTDGPERGPATRRRGSTPDTRFGRSMDVRTVRNSQTFIAAHGSVDRLRILNAPRSKRFRVIGHDSALRAASCSKLSGSPKARPNVTILEETVDRMSAASRK